jgi:hypothetical protein
MIYVFHPPAPLDRIKIHARYREMGQDDPFAPHTDPRLVKPGSVLGDG